jgi:diacylglycerol kinase family enzyme
VEWLAKRLAAEGLEPRIAWTPEERAGLVAESAASPERCRCLVAAGGDGTVSALINERPVVPISVLPVGTENLFAWHFGMRRIDPDRLAGVIAQATPRRIDLGCVDGALRFSLMAGVGFDAEVVTAHHHWRFRSGTPRPTHRAAYVWPVVRSSLSYRFPAVTVRVLDEGAAEEAVVVGTTVFVFNLPRYALGLPFAPVASENDGLLDLVVFQKPGPFRALHYLIQVFRGVHLSARGVVHRRVRRVRLHAEIPVPMQLDGDPGGRIATEAGVETEITALAGALDVLAPEGE